MTNPSFSTIPSWLSQPTQMQNVFHNQLASLKDVPSFITMPNKAPFSSGLRQALYWRKRLSPSTSSFTAIFALLGPQGLILPNVSEVCQALRNVCNILNITEFYRATNSHFIGISFNNASDASKIRSSFNYFSDSIVIHVPISSPFIHHFKLLWLPPLFPDAHIHHFLAKHSVHHSFTRDLILTGINTYSPSNSVSGTLELSPTTDVNNLPHLIPLPSPHIGNAFFIISGRSSLCLRCGQLGHVRRSCSMPRCSSCHRFHSSSSSCSSSDLNIDSAFVDSCLFDDFDSTSDSTATAISPPKDFNDVASSNFPSTLLPSPPSASSHSTPSAVLDESLHNSSCNSSSPALLDNPLYYSTSPLQKPLITEHTFSGSPIATSASDVNRLISSSLNNDSSSTTIAIPSYDSIKKKPPRKRAKHSAPELSLISSSDTKSDSQAHMSSWANQVEEALTKTTVTTSTITNTSPSLLSTTTTSSKLTSLNSTPDTTFAPLDSSPASDISDFTYAGSPLPLLFIAAHKFVSSRLQVPPSHFVASPAVPVSYCSIACPRCFVLNKRDWPPDNIMLCYKCHHPVVISHRQKVIPIPSARYIFLVLSAEDSTDPTLIDYLLLCLRLKVPLLPYHFTPRR